MVLKIFIHVLWMVVHAAPEEGKSVNEQLTMQRKIQLVKLFF